MHRLFSTLVFGSPVVHAVSLGVAQHIAGNVFHDIFYLVLADRGAVKGRVQDLWPLTVEGHRLGSATTGLGGLTLSMFKGPSRPHQVFQLLNGKAKETECLCRALAFVLPHLMTRPTNATGTSPGCWRCSWSSTSLRYVPCARRHWPLQ